MYGTVALFQQWSGTERKSLLISVFLVLALPARSQTLGYHEIQIDSLEQLLPWYSPDPAVSYDFCIRKVWDFWQNVDTVDAGVPAYMIYRTWDDTENHMGIGGDEFAMALSSWSKLYSYSGDERLIVNMRYIADTYLANGLSDSLARWPNIPYPCNTTVSATYDGDLLAGPGFT